MQESKINLANAIREARTKCGLSQKKLAEAVGLSNHAIIKIESGEGNPKFENLCSKLFFDEQKLNIRYII